MWQRLKSIFSSQKYQPLNKIEISRSNLASNYHFLSSIDPNIQIAPVIKSNAYGHGLKEISQIIDQLNPALVCVDSLYEAYELRKLKLNSPILILGYIDPVNLKVKKPHIEYAVFDLDFAKALSKFQPGSLIHLFVDTGMNREGIKLTDLSDFIQEIKKLNLKINGLMSHLASADEQKGNPQTQIQIQNFQTAIKICREEGLNLKWVHLQASSGLLQHQIPECNLARVGLALYGFDPSRENSNLKPVLTFKTKLIQIKKIPKDESVGYGATFKTKKPTTIGILPVGYFDGVDRRLSNLGIVTIDGVECPIIGRVSMNITTIDLSKVSNPYVGQEVTVFSHNPKDSNSIINSSKLCQTIPYDLLVKINPTTHREIID